MTIMLWAAGIFEEGCRAESEWTAGSPALLAHALTLPRPGFVKASHLYMPGHAQDLWLLSKTCAARTCSQHQHPQDTAPAASPLAHLLSKACMSSQDGLSALRPTRHRPILDLLGRRVLAMRPCNNLALENVVGL